MLRSTFVMTLRELRRNTMRSVLTTLGIIIGVGAVIALRHARPRRDRQDHGATSPSMGINLLIVMPGAERRGPDQRGRPPFKSDDGSAIEREVASAGDGRAHRTGERAGRRDGNNNWTPRSTGSTNEYFSVRGCTSGARPRFSDAELPGGTPCMRPRRHRAAGALRRVRTRSGAPIRVGAVSRQMIGTLVPKGHEHLRPGPGRLRRHAAGASCSAASRATTDVGDDLRQRRQRRRRRITPRPQIEALMRERRRIAPGQADDFAVQDTKEIMKTLGSVTELAHGARSARSPR